MWAGFIAKFQELAFKTIDLGRRVRLYTQEKMPLLNRAVTAGFGRVNLSLRNNFGWDLTMLTKWSRLQVAYIRA